MARIDLAQGLLIHRSVLGCPQVLDVVGCIVLHAGRNVGLHTRDHCGTQAAELVGILSVSFLRASPERVAQEIDRRCQQHGLTCGDHLVAQGLADLVLEIHVPRCSSRHGDRKHCGLAVHGVGRLNGSVQVDPARAIPERESFDPLGRVVGLAEDVGPVPGGGRPRIRAAHLLGLLRQRKVRERRASLGLELGVLVGRITRHHLRISGRPNRTGRLGNRRAARAARPR